MPPFSLGGPEPYVFSPDSTQITYVANTDPDLAISTNSDLFTIPAAGGEAKRITTNPGADEGPSYSPDGKYLAYRTQTRSGYESDQWRLAVLELQTGRMNTLTDTLDRWVESYTWSNDSQHIFFTVDDHGSTPLMMIAPSGGPIRTIAQGPDLGWLGAVHGERQDDDLRRTKRVAPGRIEARCFEGRNARCPYSSERCIDRQLTNFLRLRRSPSMPRTEPKSRATSPSRPGSIRLRSTRSFSSFMAGRKAIGANRGATVGIRRCSPGPVTSS